MKRVLLHICCGICALEAVKRLKGEGSLVAGFFFNPNIHPYEEYARRREVARKAADIAQIEIIEDEYEPQRWFNLCEKYSAEPEGGRRCVFCYELRLRRTFELCRENNFDYFTTTLTISPHKNSKEIIRIGKDIGGGYFLPADFKKKDGFKQTINLSKKHNFYRQNYCGCVYSKRIDNR